jgi:hypothetical protein
VPGSDLNTNENGRPGASIFVGTFDGEETNFILLEFNLKTGS